MLQVDPEELQRNSEIHLTEFRLDNDTAETSAKGYARTYGLRA